MRKRVVSASNPYYTLDYLNDPTGTQQPVQSSDDMLKSAMPHKKTFKFQVRELKEETGSFFTRKFDQWKEFVSKPRSLEEYVAFNRTLDKFEEELQASPDGLRIERKLLRVIQRINEGIFDWREQYRQVKRFTSIYAMFRPLKDWATCTFVNIEPVRDRILPYKLFEPFFRTPFYSDDPNHFYASAIASFFTNLFWAFLRLYVSFPCATYPRIDDELFSLMDPFSREKIRALNRTRYRKEVEEKQGFFILKLTNIIIEKFLTTEAIRWGRNSHSNAILPILTLINDLLMFGLVDHVELQQLMTNMHLISETLAFIEKSVSPSNMTDEKKLALFTQGEGDEPVDDETKTNSRELGRCKLLISQIVLQAIFVYSDYGFVSFCKKNQQRPYRVDRHEATRGRLQNNKSLYKSICLILLRYLLNKSELPVDEQVESQLEINTSLLLIFLTDSKRNYFMDSLELVHEEYASRYMNDADQSVAQRTADALAVRDELIQMIRKPSKYFKLQSILDKVGKLCEAVPDGVKDLSKDQSAGTAIDVPFTLELCWTGLTRFVLLLTERINFGQDDKVYLNPIFDLLRRLMQHNHPAQSLLFRGSTFLSYAKIFLDHKFRSMRLLIEIFENDFILLNQSYQVFDIKMSFYDHLIKQYQKGSKTRMSTIDLDKRSKDDQNFYVSVSSLLLFNIFLEKIILMNIKTSREKWRKYDLVLQIKIVNLIANDALPTLLNPTYLSPDELKQVDLGRICRFEFTKEKAIELRETIEKSNKRVALYSLFFTFLRIFVISTTYAFPKVVYTKIRNVLMRYDPENVFNVFASNIMLRTELLKLIERFWIFPNNHILYEGLNSADYIHFNRPVIPPNFLKIHKTLEGELKWVMNVEVDFEDPYDERRGTIKDYLRNALLPAIYKMVKGIQSSISILEKASVISNLRYYLEQLVSMLEFRDRKERMLTILEIAAEGSDDQSKLGSLKESVSIRRKETGKFDSMTSLREMRLPSEEELVRLGTMGSVGLRTSESQGPTRDKKGSSPQIKRSMTVIRGLQGRARKSQMFIDPSVEAKMTVDAKIGSEVFEERLNSELRKVRKHAAHIVAAIELLYQKAGQTDVPLANYKETSRSWMFEQFKPKKVLRTSEIKKQEYKKMMEEAKKNNLTVISVVKQLYMLKDFKHHSDKNPLIRLLTADSHYRQYNYNVARATISILANMTSGDSDETQRRCFFIKELYSDEIRVVNYLMNYSADLRVQMYGLLKESSDTNNSQLNQRLKNVGGEPISKAFMRGIWAVYVNLTLFLYYKTFDDKYLKYHAELHLLVSEFLRSLFTNNFNNFKLYLAECPFGVTKPGKYQFRLEKVRVNLNMLSDELMSGKHQEEQLNDFVVQEESSAERVEVEEEGSELSVEKEDSGSNTPDQIKAVEAEIKKDDNVFDLSDKSVSMNIKEQPGTVALSSGKKSSGTQSKAQQKSINGSSSDNTPDEVESIFIENFALMAELFDKCTVARDVSQTCIVPSDRSDLFAILVQVMTNLTEFVTGPCVPNQLRIYDKQTYIWNGILNRYVEDIDDDFYHVKLAVLEYIMGMIQGFNHAIIDFMSQQLQVGTIFDLTITLTRLLYLRFATGRLPSELTTHDTLNDLERIRKERAAKYANYNRCNHFETLEQTAGSSYLIESPDEIYDLYRTNREFNSHLIMQIIVHTYVFMRSIGDKIKFWQIYLKEKEDNAANWNKVHFNREANIIFKFVLEMMFSIEIVYEINDEAIDSEMVGGQNQEDRKLVTEPSQDRQSQSIDISYSKETSKLSRFGTKRRTPDGGSVEFNRSRNLGAARASEAISELKLVALNQANEMQPIIEASGPRKRVQRRFYFQTPPTTLSWTASMKERVIRNLPVKSTNRKQVYLYARLKQLTVEAELHSERHKTWGIFAYLITPDAFDLYEILLFLISLVQIMMLMGFMDRKPIHPAFIYDLGYYHKVQIVWALALTGLSFLVLVLWMVSRWKIYRIMKEKEAVATLRRRLTRWEKAKIDIFDSLIFNPTFSSFLMNFVITLLGFFVYTGIYTLNLFLAIKIFKPMSDVFVSIISSGMQLISTFQLMTLLIYFYSWVVILGLPDRLIDDWGGARNCRDLWTCLMNTWNFGLRDSGGLGESLKMIKDTGNNRFWLGWVVSLTYLILIKFIMLNIVAGIIIEGFGELREKNNQREFDVLNYCPICGMDRWKSETVGVPFDEHIGKTHNLWNYLKFLVRLNQLSEKSLVGFEFNIRNQLHYNQTRWFPKNKVLTEEVGYEELTEEEEEESEEEEGSE